MVLVKSSFLVFLSIVLYFIVFYKAKALKKSHIKSGYKNYGRFAFMLLFVLFPFWAGDFFHTLEDYSNLHNGISGGYETIYSLIAKIIPHYLIFRLIIWGGGLLILNKIFKSIPVGQAILWLMFVAIGLIWYSYARVSLAMVLMFWGCILVCDKSSTKWINIIGLFVLFISLFFHKSAVFGVSIILLSIFLANFNPRFIFIDIFIFILLFVTANSLFDVFLNLDGGSYGDFETSINSAQKYLQKDKTDIGVAKKILTTLEAFLYTSIVLVTLTLYKIKTYKRIPLIIRTFMNILLLIVLSYYLLVFSNAVNTSVMAGRFLRFSFVPASIIMAFFYDNNIKRRYVNKIYHIALLTSIGNLSYSFYNTFF